MISVARLLLICFLSGVLPASAALTISLAPAAQNAAAGATVVFSGTLANTSGTDRVFLNDIQPVLTGSAAAYLTSGSNTFFSNVPGILLPGETYSGPLFSVSRSGASPPSDYTGSANILGGSDILTTGTLASASFTVLWPEETLAATSVSSSGATLNASVDPNGVDTNVYFQYGTTISYGQTTTAVDIGSGTNNVPLSTPISGLLPNTLYHYRVVASSTTGTAYGADQTFTTPAAIPAMQGWTVLVLALSLFTAAAAMLKPAYAS
jgi:hypothetical protein